MPIGRHTVDRRGQVRVDLSQAFNDLGESVLDGREPGRGGCAIVVDGVAGFRRQSGALLGGRAGGARVVSDSRCRGSARPGRNRVQNAVERTTRFGMLTLTILICWYHHAGPVRQRPRHPSRDHPWYRHKRHIAVTDILTRSVAPRLPAAGQDTLVEQSRGSDHAHNGCLTAKPQRS